jgi:hypothetical protein
MKEMLLKNKNNLKFLVESLQVTFIIMIVGAVIGYNETLDDIKKPLQKSMAKFDDAGNSTDSKVEAITKAWNQVQSDVSCNFVTI